jgi:hypothetical protein
VNKPRISQPRPLAQLLGKMLNEAFAKQGFASTELVTRWPDIVGIEIAAHCEPEKIQWPRTDDRQASEPGTLVLRVEGPTALEIQHLSNVILERVNRFFGWQAVGSVRLRQAPLRGLFTPKAPSGPDPEIAARITAGLPEITDDNLRQALGRLGAAIKQT